MSDYLTMAQLIRSEQKREEIEHLRQAYANFLRLRSILPDGGSLESVLGGNRLMGGTESLFKELWQGPVIEGEVFRHV